MSALWNIVPTAGCFSLLLNRSMSVYGSFKSVIPDGKDFFWDHYDRMRSERVVD